MRRPQWHTLLPVNIAESEKIRDVVLNRRCLNDELHVSSKSHYAVLIALNPSNSQNTGRMNTGYFDLQTNSV
jgi:hypothetical protein